MCFLPQMRANITDVTAGLASPYPVISVALESE